MNAESQAIDILLLGSGGREHAIAKKLAASPRCGKLYIAPGNGGTSQEGENISLDENDPTAVAAFAKDHGCGMVVIGPEAPLVVGVADAVRDGLTGLGFTIEDTPQGARVSYDPSEGK